MIGAPRPQYAQIAELLRARIRDATYPAGSQFPSEDRLAQELGVSRVTINRAISILRSSGDVKVRRGSGTRVRSLPRIHRDAQATYATRQEDTGADGVKVQRANLAFRTGYRKIGRVETPPAVAAALGLGNGEPSLLRSRVLYASDEPTQITNSYLPWTLTQDCQELMRPDDGESSSYGRLADLGYRPTRFTEDVTVRMPSEAEQRTLDLEPSQPVFEIWHVAYTAEDLPIEVCVHIMPGYLWKLRYGWNR